MSELQIQAKRTSQPASVSRKASSGKTESSSFSKLFNNAVSAAQKPTDLDDIFNRASQTYGVPVNLLKAVAKAESGFDPNAVSRCGAQGVMQLMPSTAASMGVTNPLDPEQNIMAGARYLSQKISQYDGDVKLALAAYNAGSGNVAKYGGIPPFKETQTYVTRVMNYAGMSLDAPEVSSLSGGSDSSSGLSGELAALSGLGSLNSQGMLSSLGVLSALSGTSSGSAALGSLLNSSSSTENSGFTYQDYLSFLKLWVSQIQTETTQSLASSITDLSRDLESTSDYEDMTSLSDLSGLMGLTSDSSDLSALSGLSGLSSALSGISELAGSSSGDWGSTDNYNNSISLLY